MRPLYVQDVRRKRQPIESKVTSLATVLIAAAILVVGLVLMYLSVQGWAEGIWEAFLGQVGGLLVASGLLTVVWDLFGRRSFATEVLAKAKLSADVVESGITRVTDQYLDDVEWSDLFEGAAHIDIVVAYANTWRNTHRQRLERVARAKDSRIRVFLPDPDDPQTMSNLAQRFDTTPESVVAKINEAIIEYKSLAQPGGGVVEVYVRAGDALFSAYRFDGRAVLTLYSHGRERRTSVPTWVLAGGELFSFVRQEIDAICDQSTIR
ncbi:hypothetical protein [Cellulomonas hominis]|uniref:hypothetical protein n=1 Tax=Cellulomonas hominis TaxID=156981 RepID=UPI001BA25550|nr:hypothetical protein [Cellulomonas hominis]VTR76302.1 hypothetical protein CHMI_01059 [Cellulomonas hominis]